ncbi:MAG: TerB family tellurite resistance protein [Deltaproteobacteria bacterium]|nr:TerB family tellurite resistance protein [Deltaproteobacteria bacterium]MBW2359404.1 TerB family tellurite resistance protein [Deltaproteobacteria bacterium]
MKFVCSFAWADLEVQAEERRTIADLVERLELDADERKIVDGWLEVPPDPEGVDPQLVPAEHRAAFVKAIENVITADGVVTPREREQLVLLGQMLR